ncbi:methyl-accepting chemotaxis protein [Aneurinibacillus sp. BA2021]|nr:methyl-accepting chemotaxis protein [Aneurinibacillus sp. BA2021]
MERNDVMFASYRRMSFFSKTLLFSVVNILLVGIILTTASYFIQKSLMLKSLHAQAKGILGQTKITLNMKDIEAAISNLDIASPGQKKLIKQFTDLASANKNISQAYILDPKLENGKQMLIAAPQYVIDAGYKPGSMYESPPIYREVIQKTIDTKEMGVTDTYSDDLGTWISVIEPIVDDKGNMIALLGMDIDASLITKGQQELLLWLVPCLFVALLLVVLFQLFILRKVLAPLKDLFGAINQVAEGNLNVELRVTREDDFGVLSKQFNRMIQKIRQVVERVQVTAEETVGSSQTLLTHVEENKKATYQVTETFQEMALGPRTRFIVQKKAQEPWRKWQ